MKKSSTTKTPLIYITRKPYNTLSPPKWTLPLTQKLSCVVGEFLNLLNNL